MRLVMVGLDYKTAAMEIRESFSPDADATDAALRRIAQTGVDGCALLVTCNRTELYLSHHDDVPPDGVELLCAALGADAKEHRDHFTERNERQAVEHLLRVAGGLESSVLGDDQIITQVRRAAEAARKAGVADPLIEALFRTAVSAGKKIKTSVSFAREGASVASRAASLVKDRAAKRVLVIGNGVIGKLTARELLAAGASVRMTLRDIRRASEMPEGCECIDFAERYAVMTDCDAVVSATASPHRTVEYREVEKMNPRPRLFVDLAVPRDIDPEIATLDEIEVVNVDDMTAPGEGDMTRQFAAAAEIVTEETRRFDAWRRNHPSRVRAGTGAPDFPIFINLHGATVLLAGGGKVALRRAEKLLLFGAKVHVVSPELSPEMLRLRDREGFVWTRDVYHERYMENATLAIAATDSRETNRRVGIDARKRGILVSVADRREECTFYFPAIVRSDFLTAGLVSNNNDHTHVRKAAATLRREMENIDEDYQGGQQGERLGGAPGQTGYGSRRAALS